MHRLKQMWIVAKKGGAGRVRKAVKKALILCFAALMFPYIITLARTGKVERGQETPAVNSGKRILLDRNGTNSYMDVEEYLPGVVAKQIPADYGREALRAQAIIARTYIYGKMNGQNEVKESELQIQYLEKEQMKKLWGSESFAIGYEAIEDAVGSTAKTVITSNEVLIDPLFHRASTGKTRAGDENHPYLEVVDCPKDVEAEGFLTVMTWTLEEFAGKVNTISGDTPVSAKLLQESIQIISRDGAGYVEQLQVGSKIYSGEEIRYVLGLPSTAYGFEEYEGKIRAICTGIGHGYGLSQYTARQKAGEGFTGEDILSCFYKNIVLISE